MNIVSSICILFLILSTINCEGQDLDALIREVFQPVKKQPRNEQIREVDNNEQDSIDCVCVPYYLCKNNTISTDGATIIDIRVKQQNCDSDIDICCQKPSLKKTLDVTQKITPAPIVRSGCGRRNPEGIGFRITGDTNGEAQFGEFPWMVAVISPEITPEKELNVYQCGGALIHPQVVMTSAHCVSNTDKSYKIRAGEWDTQTNNELFPHQEVKVQKVVIHPEYKSGSLYNDVALLFLDPAVTLGDNVDTICLPRRDDIFDYSRCYASGWGKDVFGKEGRYQVILKKIDLPVVPRLECESALRNTRLGPYFQLHHSFICAGGEEGKDTCKGDGGSPLVCPLLNDKNKYVQAGIVAWGISCGEKGIPGVYANVASFRDWIDEQLLYYNLDTQYYEY